MSDEELRTKVAETIRQVAWMWEPMARDLPESCTRDVEFIMSLIKSRDQQIALEADLKGTIEAAEQIWSIYQAPSRDGGKMFDFDKLLPGQIEDWKKQLATLKSKQEKEQ